MENNWKIIKNWLSENCSELLQELNPGINQKQIDELEKKIGTKLPGDFISFYKIHNGQETHGDYGLFEFKELLSFERISEVWDFWNAQLNSPLFTNISDPDKGIRNHWWNSLWIPITQSEGGDCVCMDLAPAQGGKIGQIISVLHDDDVRSLLADSFTEWITNYSRKFETGEIVFSEDFGILDKETLKSMMNGNDE